MASEDAILAAFTIRSALTTQRCDLLENAEFSKVLCYGDIVGSKKKWVQNVLLNEEGTLGRICRRRLPSRIVLPFAKWRRVVNRPHFVDDKTVLCSESNDDGTALRKMA